jgi:hypothetical protein
VDLESKVHRFGLLSSGVTPLAAAFGASSSKSSFWGIDTVIRMALYCAHRRLIETWPQQRQQ